MGLYYRSNSPIACEANFGFKGCPSREHGHLVEDVMKTTRPYPYPIGSSASSKSAGPITPAKPKRCAYCNRIQTMKPTCEGCGAPR